ncbi:MAG: SO2930 family diheme c-type cytochrome, partial [Hyphococcus sp.]
MMRRLVAAGCVAAALLSSACEDQPPAAPVFHADENPAALSDWGMIAAVDDALQLSEGVVPYDLATPLFSDYALKLRTVWTPDGAPAQYDADAAFDFPIGTVITKTFYYPQSGPDWNGAVGIKPAPALADDALPLDGVRLIETRLLVRRQDGWDALPYVWNDAQTDAVLMRTGAVKALSLERPGRAPEEFAYIVPNANQCAGCHATNSETKAIHPIGMKARHLNKPSSFRSGFNQLDHWRASGLLAGDIPSPAPQNAAWTDEAASLDARARAYLDI